MRGKASVHSFIVQLATGIVSMALLRSYGVSDEEIIKDYMRTNRNAFCPTLKKCLGIGLMTWNWDLVKTAYNSFMAQRELIVTALKEVSKTASE